MYKESSPTTGSNPQADGELVEVGNFYIIDLVGNNPLKPGQSRNVIQVGNATEADLEAITKGQIKIDVARFGTRQRVLLKVVSVENLK